MDNSALWVTGLLAVGVIAAIQSTAAAFLITSGGIITRDLYKTYVNKNISWENELVAVRIITMLIFFDLSSLTASFNFFLSLEPES